MPNLSAAWAHLIIGLAGIGAFAGLAVAGVINGADAVAGIGAFGGVGLGATAVSIGAGSTTTTTTGTTTTVPGQ